MFLGAVIASTIGSSDRFPSARSLVGYLGYYPQGKQLWSFLKERTTHDQGWTKYSQGIFVSDS
ncbi:unnamed protein product [marine sediment metagenome]|uniref:Uncharacterized protein n=1 Tax=marine sediment metagenome TaxID=412755 RepID=X1P428_9ZZZZ